MRVLILLTILILVSHVPAGAFPYWDTSYGTDNDDVALAVTGTKDGGLVVVGHTGPCCRDDALIVKLKSSGEIAWQKALGGDGYEEFRSVTQTSDGGYIAVGYTSSAGNSRDALVVKFDSNGNLVWQKAIGGKNNDEAYYIQQTSEGGYIIAGYTRSAGGWSKDAWIIKLNPSGRVVWQKAYGGDNNDEAYSIWQTSDGGYVVSGYTYSAGIGYRDAWIAKLDATGNLVWQKAIGGGNDDEALSVVQASDGGYVVAGITHSIPGFYKSAWVIKLNSKGEVVWRKAYGGYSVSDREITSIHRTSDGGYIAVGSAYCYGNNAWIVKLNSNGDIIWQRAFKGKSSTYAYHISELSNGNYAVVGEYRGDMLVMVIDHNGNVPDCDYELKTVDTTVVDNACSLTVKGINFGVRSVDLASRSTELAVNKITLSYLVECEYDTDYDYGPVIDSLSADRTSGKAPLGVNFYCRAHDEEKGGEIVEYKWDFDSDGVFEKTTKTGGASYTYASAGFYNATCCAVSKSGKESCEGIVVEVTSVDWSSYTWSSTTGGKDDDYFYAVSKTSDGGFIAVGSSESNGDYYGDLYVVKFNPNGKVAWKRLLGNNRRDVFYEDGAFGVRATADGGAVVVGYTYTFVNNMAGWLLRFGPDGSLLWQKTFWGKSGEIFYALDILKGGDYLIVGKTYSFGSGYEDALMIRVDQSGNVIWEKAIGGKDDDRAIAVSAASDGGFFAAGATQSFGYGGWDAWAGKFDANGNILWQRVWGGSDDDYAFDVKATSDGGCIVVGGYGSDAFAVKIDASGNIQWKKVYSGDGKGVFKAVVELPDGYLVAGHYSGGCCADTDGWVIKLDKNGNILWQNMYGWGKDDSIRDIAVLSNGYVLAGYTKGSSSYYHDGWLLKVDTQGSFGDNVTGCPSLKAPDISSKSMEANIKRVKFALVESHLCKGYVTAKVFNLPPEQGECFGTPVASVNNPPVATTLEAEPSSGYAPLEVSLTCEASDPDGNIVFYKWDFDGDGVVDESTTLEQTSHLYEQPGTYQVSCYVVDDNGAESNRVYADVEVEEPESGNETDDGTGGSTFECEVREFPNETVVIYKSEGEEPPEYVKFVGGELSICMNYDVPVVAFVVVFSKDYSNYWWLTPSCSFVGKDQFSVFMNGEEKRACSSIELPITEGYLAWMLFNRSDWLSINWENDVYLLGIKEFKVEPFTCDIDCAEYGNGDVKKIVECEAWQEAHCK